jgi:hypothetical protein
VIGNPSEASASKVPEVTLIFWIIKIAATTLGETGGDTVTMTLNWGYLIGTAISFQRRSRSLEFRFLRGVFILSFTGPPSLPLRRSERQWPISPTVRLALDTPAVRYRYFCA